MTTILHLDSSAKMQGSTTRQLTADAVTALKKQHPDAKVIYRDLVKNPLPHISPEYIAGVYVGGEYADHETLKISDTLLEELFAADVLVIGAPIYNFGVPSQLKSWIDHVVRVGKTFNYTPEGPKGFVTGKRAIIAFASGGIYSSGPMVAFDHVVPYLKQVLGFLGISDVTVFRAEKQSLGAEAASAELTQAKQQIEKDIKRAA